jgi:ribosomal protein S18 acetylase RimI-like enzyme
MIKLANILFENHPLSVEVQKLENDLKVKYPSIDKLGIYMDKPKNSLFLSDLYVKNQFRGTGVGSAVMKDITDYADSRKLPVVLIREPESETRSSLTKLINFYKKFGFVINKGRNVDYLLSEPFSLSMYRLLR